MLSSIFKKNQIKIMLTLVLYPHLSFQQKSPQLSPVKQLSVHDQNIVEEEESALAEYEEELENDVEDEESGELAAEARALTRHLKSIHKEKSVISSFFI